MSGDAGRAETELKAVVARPDELAARLAACGAAPEFRGRMADRRYDFPARALEAGDQVLRVRSFTAAAGSAARGPEVAWKGPTGRSGGYKQREELEFTVGDAAAVEAVLGRLGFVVTDAIDRCVVYYRMCGAVLRLEWYPRMDVLLEVEGPPAAIEAAVAATGIPRSAFTAERLVDFAARYAQRTGRSAALNLAALDDAGVSGVAGWPDWAP